MAKPIVYPSENKRYKQMLTSRNHEVYYHLMKHQIALAKAITLFGTQAQLAKSLGVSAMAVSKWIKRDNVPPHRALQIEQATHGAIHRSELRPDLWEPPSLTRERGQP